MAPPPRRSRPSRRRSADPPTGSDPGRAPSIEVDVIEAVEVDPPAPAEVEPIAPIAPIEATAVGGPLPSDPDPEPAGSGDEPVGVHRKAAPPIAPEAIMANMETALKEAMTIEGAVGVALVDYTSGMALGILGGSKELDLNVAAAGNTDVMRAKMRTMEMLHLGDQIEDILITLGKQYHLIRPLSGRAGKGLFLYLVLMKDRANLALARHSLKRVEEEIEV
ncbi:hypothetical protein EHYA_08677 [Embleya hyalina]|uniref:Roadblock/LAMTOR2 domain-containing protein n=2 Tax=Streptomycetaceae TaxID=2062 RepID=A0A401Z2E2_9ACTN|nr:hypothetical protein EHYA_08677 [Embleya hyalina]